MHSLLTIIHIIIINPIIIMVAGIIMEVITETATIIIVETDIVMDTTTTMDIVTIRGDAIVLKMVDMVTTTAEAIINDLLITEQDADNSDFTQPVSIPG